MERAVRPGIPTKRPCSNIMTVELKARIETETRRGVVFLRCCFLNTQAGYRFRVGISLKTRISKRPNALSLPWS